VAQLRQNLEALGPVNLESIQEYEELERRYVFMERECTDLTTARTELMDILHRINTETQRLFSETFEQVRLNFQASFKELFGAAASSDLVLSNVDDPLESGIEIIAKPPGKKPSSITLLSGGERSMTAVALLFSIYMVKPSPFCVLDELDAPLDEANIERFLDMLDRFIDRSQFVIVTHNKKTMRRADIMYGVSMEEKGISRPIGLKLTQNPDLPVRVREPKKAPSASIAATVASPESAGTAAKSEDEIPSQPLPKMDAGLESADDIPAEAKAVLVG
jgi:chromosome segregation protein